MPDYINYPNSGQLANYSVSLTDAYTPNSYSATESPESLAFQIRNKTMIYFSFDPVVTDPKEAQNVESYQNLYIRTAVI